MSGARRAFRFNPLNRDNRSSRISVAQPKVAAPVKQLKVVRRQSSVELPRSRKFKFRPLHRSYSSFKFPEFSQTLNELSTVGSGIKTNIVESSTEMAAKTAVLAFKKAVHERGVLTCDDVQSTISVSFVAGPITVQIDELPIIDKY